MRVLSHFTGSAVYNQTPPYTYSTNDGSQKNPTQWESGDKFDVEAKNGVAYSVNGYYRITAPNRAWMRTRHLPSLTAVYKEVASPSEPWPCLEKGEGATKVTEVTMGTPLIIQENESSNPDHADFAHHIWLYVGDTLLDKYGIDPLKWDTGEPFTEDDPRFGVVFTEVDTSNNVSMYTIPVYSGKSYFEIDTSTLNFAQYCTDSDSVTITILMRTYYEGALEGERQVNVTLKLPDTDDWKPTISQTAMVDFSPAQVDGYLYQGISTYELHVNCQALGDTALNTSACTLTLHGAQKTNQTVNVSADGSALEFVCTVRPTQTAGMVATCFLRDVRGRIITKTFDLPDAQAYFRPSFTSVSSGRYLSNGGAEDGNGTFLGINPIVSWTSALGVTHKVSLHSKTTESTVWTNEGEIPYGAMSYHDGYGVDDYYNLRLYASDFITLTDGSSHALSEVLYEGQLSGGQPILDLWGGGKGVAFGMTATRENVLEVGGKYKLAGDGVFETWTHTKTGTVHNFEGYGTCGKARITDTYYDGETVTVNGETVAAYIGSDPLDSLPVGRWVSFVYDDAEKTLDFRAGSGVKLRVIAAPNGTAELVGKEGQVAAETDVPIGRVWLRNSTPTGDVQAGDVWVQFHDESSLEVPLDTAGRYAVGITRLWQYDGTEWVLRKSYLFRDGAWVSMETILFADGELWDKGTWTRETENTGGTFTQYDDRVTISVGTGENRTHGRYTTNAFDVTQYGSLHVNAVVKNTRSDTNEYYHVKLGVCNVNSSGNASNIVKEFVRGDGETMQEYVIDLTGVTGEKHIYAFVGVNRLEAASRRIDIYRVWLEY